MSGKANIANYLNKVFLKDVLELLKELPEESVDIATTA